MGAAYTFNMGGAAILCTLFVTLYGFRTIPPVGSASMDYYDEAVDSTTPTVPVKPANSTKPDITLFSATVVNPRRSRPTPDSDASLPFEPSPKRATSSENDDPYDLPGKCNIDFLTVR